jgi:hypothetical protein
MRSRAAALRFAPFRVGASGVAAALGAVVPGAATPSTSLSAMIPDDLGAAIFRLEFLLHHIMAGLVTPARAKTEAAKRDQSIQ